MNRLELEAQIIKEGKKRNIIVERCDIHDRGDHLDFYITIQNDYAENWVYKNQIETLIHDLAPIERCHKVQDIRLGKTRYKIFKIGDKVEMEDLWIRLHTNEKEPDIIKVNSVCGPWRSGWITGIIFETPEQNDRLLGIKFDRDVWMLKEYCYIHSITDINNYITEGKMRKVDMGQPIWCGTHSWSIRKKKNI